MPHTVSKAGRAAHSSFSHVGNAQGRVLLGIQMTVEAQALSQPLGLIVLLLTLSSAFSLPLCSHSSCFLVTSLSLLATLVWEGNYPAKEQSKDLTHVWQIDASTYPSAPHPWLQIIVTMETSTIRASAVWEHIVLWDTHTHRVISYLEWGDNGAACSVASFRGPSHVCSDPLSVSLTVTEHIHTEEKQFEDWSGPNWVNSKFGENIKLLDQCLDKWHQIAAS